MRRLQCNYYSLFIVDSSHTPSLLYRYHCHVSSLPRITVLIPAQRALRNIIAVFSIALHLRNWSQRGFET